MRQITVATTSHGEQGRGAAGWCPGLGNGDEQANEQVNGQADEQVSAVKGELEVRKRASKSSVIRNICSVLVLVAVVAVSGRYTYLYHGAQGTAFGESRSRLSPALAPIDLIALLGSISMGHGGRNSQPCLPQLPSTSH